MNKVAAIILAGGEGKRMGFEKPKQFLKLAGKMIIEHSLEKFIKTEEIDEIIIVCHHAYKDFLEEILLTKNYSKPVKVITGGKTRQESSYYGLRACSTDVKYVLIHDAVRPHVSIETIKNVIKALKSGEVAVDVAIPSTDTIIVLDKSLRYVTEIPDRKRLWRGQTPQGFRYDTILKAHELARKDRYSEATDDCSLILKYNLGKVFVVRGSEENIKITYPIDLCIADELFRIKSSKLKKDIDPSFVKEKLADRVVVIFGHTSGIGKEIYEKLKELGIKVYGFSRKNGVDVRRIERIEEALRQVFSKEGRIDYVIVTAGILHRGMFDKMSLESIKETIETNFLGCVNVAYASIKYLEKSNGMLILFGSSSYTRGRPLSCIYSATKAALVNFMQGLASELYPRSIKVNIISPERTKTPMREKAFGNEDPTTLLEPEDVANVTINLMLTDLTGQVIKISKFQTQ